MVNKKNQKVIDYIISIIEKRGFKQDVYGNYKKDEYRFKFNQTSYRYEKRIDTKPISWIKVGGTYYKNVATQLDP